MPKFHITTLGCKVNRYDSNIMAKQLEEQGWQEAKDRKDANICIINTCAVTQKAAMQSRQATRQAIRINPNAKIIATGCHAKTDPDDLLKIDGLHAVIKEPDQKGIVRIAVSDESILSGTTGMEKLSNEKFQYNRIAATGKRTRPVLKIQDGCNSFCSYCIVPFARGKSRSMPQETVLDHLNQLKQKGVKEAVLSGIHLGAYGKDLDPETSLYRLLVAISKTKTVDRVRLSSIEPGELSSKIIQLVSDSDAICKHFHIPLQSGDNEILKRMLRPYTGNFFEELVIGIRDAIEEAGIGVDILIGFPGETDAAFYNTYTLIKRLPVTYLHVFPFSPRKKTPAWSYKDRIPQKIIKERCRKMRELGAAKKREFLLSLIGTTKKVLIEGKKGRAAGIMKGMTSNYAPVYIEADDELKNKFVYVRIERLLEVGELYGRIIE